MRAKRLTVNSSSVAYVSFDFQFVESILGNTTPKGTNTPIQQNADKTLGFFEKIKVTEMKDGFRVNGFHGIKASKN